MRTCWYLEAVVALPVWVSDFSGWGGQSLGPGVATPSDFATCGFRHWVLRRMCGAGGLDVRQCDNEPPLLESQAS